MTVLKPIINMKHCTFAHQGGYPILRDLSLQIHSGDRIGLIGPNGTGKTTLFLLLSGIYQTNSGEIYLYDRPLIKGEFRSEMGMVFQDQDDQVFCPSVKDDIAFGPVNMGFTPSDADERAREAAERLGINHLLDRVPHHLSGGEKRLVALAGIIAMKPSFIMYDEPTSNLDMRYRRRLIHFLNETANQDGMIVASHDLEFILEVCNRVILMDEGQIIADGDPVEILSNEVLLNGHGLERPFSLR